MSEEKRVALLVDGENLASEHAGLLILTAAKQGALGIKRVFGSVARIDGWTAAPGFRVVHVPSGKSSADIALSLEALELALTRQVDGFVIATSDRDLALVAQRLAELGFPVTGIGESKAPVEFRKACRSFTEIPQKKAKPAERPQDFEDRLRCFLEAEGQEADGWVSLSSLGQQRAKELSISKAEAGLGKNAPWSDWFKKRPEAFEIEERGTQSRARLKPAN